MTGVQTCALPISRNKIARVKISSSHDITQQDLDAIERFLVNQTGLSIIYTYAIDKKLIAGIRLQSNTLLWECSINKQLTQIKLAYMH